MNPYEKIRNASIRGKMITLITASNILTGLLVIALLVIIDVTCQKYQEAYDNYGVTGNDVSYALALYNECLSNVNTAAIAQNPQTAMAAVSRTQACMEELATVLDKIEEEIVDDDARVIFKDARAEIDKVKQLATQALAASASGAQAQVLAMLQSDEVTDTCNRVKTYMLDLHAVLDDYGKAALDGCSMNQKFSNGFALVIMLLAIALVIQIGTVISKSIREPAKEMRDAADKLAVGDVDVVINQKYKDEIGELSASLKAMADTIREQAGIAKQVSGGNMDIEVVPKGDRDLLGNSLANMVSEENRVMSGIRSAVMEIRTGSEEVAAASQSLAQGSTQQASAIQQITASLSDITERTKINASDATNANTLVSRAKVDASEGNDKMHEMITAMADINESSENISKIIKVIDDIAFQTNILALNAAVEAARAGQHGRGFAVVADEVRNLAGKSAQAASETAQLIEDSIAKVNKGSKLAEETARALDAIVKVIDEIVGITNSIAVASNDQATAITQIDQAINQVSMVVQTNSATSQQCAAASEELSAQAGKLREMIRRYNLKSNAEAETSSYADSEPVGLPDDEFEEAPPVIVLDDGFGKY